MMRDVTLAAALVTLVFVSARVATAQDIHQHDAPPTNTGAMTRDASGTAWQPSLSPMHAIHRQAGEWALMFHGKAFAQYLREFAPEHRGNQQAGSINWVMAMGTRPVAGGRLGLRTMLSLEPWTIAGCGYPDLLATGELCNGDSIHDRQHPHDLFMELAAAYERPLTAALRWQLYGGPAGEPALGPPGFPHRASAASNPIAPISHHWLDATHITFGVVTTGLSSRTWKAEASLFNGREPDENRADFDLAPLDSVSGRAWFTPTDRLAFQVSAGHLAEAEKAHLRAPRVDVDRVTASAAYHRPFGERDLWATTIAWGANTETGETTHAALVESTLSFSDRDAVFGRLEINAKPAHDLHIHESNDVFTVGSCRRATPGT